MSQFNPADTEWTDQENDLIVADYFDMLRMEMLEQPFVKAERNRALQSLTGRSAGSIEFKHQNISAVLDRLGMRWIRGYRPRFNFQTSLIAAVERFLDADRSLFDGPDYGQETSSQSRVRQAPTGMAAPVEIYLEEPPELFGDSQDNQGPETLNRLIRKFDPAIRDARNRTLGMNGEARIFDFERNRLKAAGRADLAKNVRWVSKEDGDGAGYDIHSFNVTGQNRLIEVKTTCGFRTTPFYISENERSLSVERPDEFRLLRLYDFCDRPRAFELQPPLGESVNLWPTEYRATFGN